MTGTLATSILTSEQDQAGPGCGCCKPPEPTTVEEQIAELRARQDAVERRLRGLRQA